MRKKDEVDINKTSRFNILFSLSLKLNYVRVILIRINQLGYLTGN